MIIYHGTNKIQEIEENGFVIGKSRHAQIQEDGVYFSDTHEYASQYGAVIKARVPDEYVELYQENPLLPSDDDYIPGHEYIVYKEDLEHIEIL